MTEIMRLQAVWGAAIVMASIWCGWDATGAPAQPAAAVEQTNIVNPHSDLIFRATGATSCRDCHRTDREGGIRAQVQDNDLVQGLKAKAKGIHGPGRFADCLRCHAGGDKGVEKYRQP